MDFKTALIAMAQARPDVEATLVIDLALAVENALPPDLNDSKALGRWAARQHVVAVELDANRKIPAIKALRGLTHCSLLQAKNAVEAI